MAQRLDQILDSAKSGLKTTQDLGRRLAGNVTKASEAAVDGTQQLLKDGREAYESAAKRARDFADEYGDEIAKVQELAASVGKSTVKMTADALEDLRASRLGRNMATSGAAGALLAVPVPLIGPITGALLGAALGAYITLTTEEKVVGRIPYQSQLAIALEELDRMRREGLVTPEQFEQQREAVLAEARAAHALT